MADAHDVTIIGTKEVEGIVGLLDYQKLAGHFGKAEIVADMGFLHFAEGYGYGEVFYHDTVIWCKDRIFRRKKALPVGFSGKARYLQASMHISYKKWLSGCCRD